LHLTSLRTVQWRNLADAEHELSPRVNVLVGGNGQGKTNFLEAVQYLALGRSHRGSRDDEILRFGADHWFVRGVGRGEREESLTIEAGFTPPRSKRIKVDAQPVARLSDLMGVLTCVSFGPEDAELARGGPQHRRRWIDYAIAETSRSGLQSLGEYRRVVQQRAALLRDTRGAATASPAPVTVGAGGSEARSGSAERNLGIWDAEQVRLGVEVMVRRVEALADLAPRVAAAFARLGSGQGLRLRYAAHATGRSYDAEGELAALREDLASGAVAARFRDRMRERRGAERVRGTSLVGPHRDDIELVLGDRDVRRFGSQGQGRAAAIALKMAQAEFIGARRGVPPIVVLDDVFAELDEERAARLWAFVSERHQTFLAVPRRGDAQFGRGDAEFEVESGVLRRRS
jgi:DNA replication and repair protein RecF